MRFPPCWEGAGQEGELSPQPPAGDGMPLLGPGAAGPRPLLPLHSSFPAAPGMAPLVPVLPLKAGTLFPECPQSAVLLLLLPSKTFRFEAVVLLTYLAAGKIRPACLSRPPQQQENRKEIAR